jgi:hypothetical protein
MGAVASLFKRTAATTTRAAHPTFRFVCHLDRLPPHLPELDECFRQYGTSGCEVLCEVPAKDFADAVADAIRTLEEGYCRVEGIERLDLVE